MKRFILLLAVLCIGVQAHAGLVPKAKIGLKAGWNYQANKLKGAKDFDFNSDSGWYAGLQSELTWGMLGIRPELVYSRNKFDVAGPQGVDGSVKMNTIDLPVLLQLRFLNFLAVQAGPTFNLMTDTGGSTQGTTWNIDHLQPHDRHWRLDAGHDVEYRPPHDGLRRRRGCTVMEVQRGGSLQRLFQEERSARHNHRRKPHIDIPARPRILLLISSRN